MIRSEVMEVVNPLYEFQGQDFSKASVKQRFTQAFHRVLGQLRQEGVIIVNDDLPAPRGARNMLQGIVFEMGEDIPTCVYNLVKYQGRKV